MSYNHYTTRLAESGDEQQWDAFVADHPDASPYHLMAWKTATEEAYGHPSCYLLAEQGGQLKGVLPLIHLKLPLLVNELTALPFCDVGGPLCDDEYAGKLLIERAVSLARERGADRLHLRGACRHPQEIGEMLHREETGKVRMLLALPDSAEQLFSDFKSKLRSQIRKAEKNGLVFHWSAGKDEVEQYYSVFSENMRDLGSPVHSPRWFSAILASYGDRARMGIVSFEEKPVACCMLLSAGKTIAIPWASTLRSYNRLAPNMLLYWNALKYAADGGFDTFDFGRSSEGEGTFRFKKQWGAQPEPLVWYSTIPPRQDSTEKDGGSSFLSRETLAGIWSRLPLPLANSLGPMIRKYISL